MVGNQGGQQSERLVGDRLGNAIRDVNIQLPNGYIRGSGKYPMSLLIAKGEASIVVYAQMHACGPSQLLQSLGLRDGASERFFAEDMQAALESGRHGLDVQIVGGGHRHDVQTRGALEQLFERRVGLGLDLVRDRCGTPRVDVADGDESCMTRAVNRLRMQAADKSAANDRRLKWLRIRHATLAGWDDLL